MGLKVEKRPVRFEEIETFKEVAACVSVSHLFLQNTNNYNREQQLSLPHFQN